MLIFPIGDVFFSSHASPPTLWSREARCCAAIYYSCSNPLPAQSDTWSGCCVLWPTERHSRPLDLYLLWTSLLVLGLGLHVSCHHEWNIIAFDVDLWRLWQCVMSKIIKKKKKSFTVFNETVWLQKKLCTIFSRQVSPESQTHIHFLSQNRDIGICHFVCCISHGNVLDTLT